MTGVRMRYLLCAVLLACLSLSALLATAADTTPRSMLVFGQLVIDREGGVRDCTVESTVAPKVAELVKRAVLTWKFAPILRDGHPIEGRTQYVVDIEATPVDAGYAMKVTGVSFQNPRKMVAQPMVGLDEIRRYRQDVDVLAALRADKDGNVTDVAVVAVQGPNGAAVRNRRGYELAVERMVRKWKFEPARLDLGDDATIEGLLPFNFHGLGGRNIAWRPEWKDIKPIPWSTSAPPDASKLKDGQVMALDDKVKLRTDVVGSTL